MQAIYPGQANTIEAPVVALADNSAIISGTVSFYLRAKNGTYAGKWLDGSVASTEDIADRFSVTEASAGDATYVGGAIWELELDAAVWMQNVSWQLYWAESGSLHKPDSDVIYPMGVAADGTITTTPAQGVVDICNYAIAILGSVANATRDALDTFDGNPLDPSSEPGMAWCQRLYPRARDYAQIKLAPPECLRYVASGAALTGASLLSSPGWEYHYAKPSGCIHFLGVVNVDQHDAETGEDAPLAYQEIGQQIACDYGTDDILFKYVVRVDDCTKFSEGLVMVIAHRLAYLIARPMGVDAAGRQAVLNEFEPALEEARGMTAQRCFVRKPELTVDKAHYRRGYTNQSIRDPEGRVRMI